MLLVVHSSPHRLLFCQDFYHRRYIQIKSNQIKSNQIKSNLDLKDQHQQKDSIPLVSYTTSRRSTYITGGDVNARCATCTDNLSAINAKSLKSRTKRKWHAARKIVVVEIQPRHLGQETMLGWNRSRQSVVEETQI